jgi:large subunit ribosomal protein L25
MAIVPLSGVLRERAGKGPARSARRAGDIPGVLYGHGQAATPLTVNQKEFINAIRHVEGGNMIVSLRLGSGEKTALVREVQLDPISHDIIHLDFQEVSLTEKVRVQVAVHFTGIATGVKDGGGILETIARQVEVECLATSIPSFLEADVSALEVGDSLHASDLGLPEGVVLLTEGDQTIATCVPPTVYEAPVAAEAAPTAAEPELVAAKGKEDKEEGDEKPEKGEKGEKGEKEKK